MKEIGGYIEIDTYHLPMLHEGAIALNCGRNALAYLFKSRKIEKIKIPYFICASIPDVCDREGVQKSFYHIGLDFKPEKDLVLDNNEWLYLVNYYGQLSNEQINTYVEKYRRVIVDQANSYFQEPIQNVDTIYTCRKYFGVPDGAFLYTKSVLNEEYPIDVSFERMHFLLGRFEKTATEFYEEYCENNNQFKNEPIKRMSKLTNNLLHGINYKEIKSIRMKNFEYLHSGLSKFNQLNISRATFMYPFFVENGAQLRKRLIKKQIYIPVLWPFALNNTWPHDLEHVLAENILPLPIDQRYGQDDLEFVLQLIIECL